MKEALLNILDNIYIDIEDNSSPSLLIGSPGITLFKLYYLKHIKGGDISDVEPSIQELSELAVVYNNLPSFCGGQAGINWFFNFLSKQGYIDKADYKLIGSTDPILAEVSLGYLQLSFYDYLHGALGIAHHLLYTKNKTFKPFLKKFLDGIIALMGKKDPILYHYDFDLSAIDKNKINPSLSHGLTSVLKFCMECYKTGIYKRKSKRIAKIIVDFLLANRNDDHTECYYPYIYDLAHQDNQQSRLSWCYGDLTIAYIVFQYGSLFEDKAIEKSALEILHHSSKRRGDKEAQVVDAGFCHGTVGIAYIFNKLWHKTKDPLFLEASNFWFQKTIDFSMFPDGIAGYKKYDNVNKTWENDSSLLEGVAGIGLSIIGYLFKDYSWDYV